MATENTIHQVVKLLYAAPLANKPDPAGIVGTINVFMATLSDIEDGLLKASVAHHIATSKWFPAVADLRSTALARVNHANDTPDAYTAWKEVNRAMNRYISESELHPLALKAINALGGIRQYGQADIDDHISWRSRFISVYEQYQRRAADDAMMLPAVAGYLEQRRELNGNSIGGLITALTGQMTGGQ